jgi:hypothetical protein
MQKAAFLIAIAAIIAILAYPLGSETGVFELVAHHPSGKGYLLTERREFSTSADCENVAKVYRVTTFGDWRCVKLTK